jgi:hypothetical protein
MLTNQRGSRLPVKVLAHGRHQFGSFLILERLLLELRREIRAFDVLGDNAAGSIIRAADIMHRHDAGMIEIGNGPSFGQMRFSIFWSLFVPVRLMGNDIARFPTVENILDILPAEFEHPLHGFD